MNRFSILVEAKQVGTGVKIVGVLLGLAVGILSAPLVGEAQQAGKVPRIGWLSAGSSPSGPSPNLEAFRQGLRELGWIEGQNIALEYRWADGKLDRLHELVAELVRLKVDVIVATAGPVTLAAQQATRAIPIVMIQSGDPIGAGLIASLARPGGNVTGIITLSAELIGKRMQLLKEAFPRVSRVAVLSRAASPFSAGWFKEMEVAARSLGVLLQSLEVRGPEEFGTAFEAATRGRADALMELPNPIFHQNRKRIVDFATKSGLPAMFHTRDFVAAGGLMSYGANYVDLYRRAASYVDKILKGTKPADLPVEQPTKFELVINLKAAKARGLRIPQSILVRADQVIQ